MHTLYNIIVTYDFIDFLNISINVNVIINIQYANIQLYVLYKIK
jgi:hypothetical protein